MSSGPELPSGTVTFLFTDIEGSTRLLKQLRDGYAAVLTKHQELLRAAFAAHGGQVVDTQGDAFFVVFRRAKDAVDAAAAGQRSLATHAWPEGVELRVRMGIHTGQGEPSGGRYHGLAVHRASRIGDAAHGGQVLVSQTTRDLLDDEEEEAAGIELRELGEQRLKDLDRPVRLHQLVVEGLASEFPPLRKVVPPITEEGAPRSVPRRLRLRVAIPVAVVVIGGGVAAGVLLTRGSSGSALASTGVAADSVGVFDRSGKLLAQAAVRKRPSAVVIGFDAIWVTNVDDDSVSRIDPATNASVQTIAVGNGPSGITVGGGFVWVANYLAATVSQVDPRTNGVVKTIPVGGRPSGVAFGAGGVWVADASDRTVKRIDPQTDAIGKSIPVDAGADAIAVGEGSVWVISRSSGSVTKIDPRSGNSQRIIVGHGPIAVAVGGGSVWVTNSLDGTVSRIDPASNTELARIPVGVGPSGVAVSPEGKDVWVSNEQGGTLSNIDPSRGIVVNTVPTGNRPAGVALSQDALYVTVRASGGAHRGGTLRLVSGAASGTAADALDPAVAYTTDAWQMLIITNDGLVTYKRVGGSEGTGLVPDLATSLPLPTDRGRTYTFQLRLGLRYSNGAPVRPGDFRRAIERSLGARTPSGNTGPGRIYFTGIVGASACVKTPKKCDLTRGIVTGSNTVSFHLTAPDPEFVYKLALPSADAVPVSTPLSARLPLPATGPYEVASYRSNRDLSHIVVRLVRNPHFHEWSAAAQPAGYPDEIVLDSGAYTDDGAVRAVEQGKADLTGLGSHVSAPLRADVHTRYSPQLHSNPGLLTLALFLNTRVPPFNSLKARQAFSYAIDRNRIAELNGGSELNHTTCQLLPPDLAGYRPYCPYTRHRSMDGTYHGPDLAKAKRLVAASGTMGQTVTFNGGRGFIDRDPKIPYVRAVLGQLGYKTRLNVVSPKTFGAEYGDSRRKWQAITFGWAADYPAASSFFVPNLTCAAFKPGTTANLNFSEFCDPRIDAEIARARSLEAADPQAAAKVWANVDRAIVDQAPWVPYLNPQNVEFVSRRVGNYIYSLWVGGALLDQLWVR